MELNKLKGNTYFIDAPTNIGVYVFKNKFCLLVDSGLDNSAARKIDDILKKNGLHPKYIINTHAHTDHYGGNHYFKENYTGTLVYTSEKESIYMKNSELFSTILFSSNAPKKLTNRKPFVADEILKYGINKINDEKFEVLSLKGHSHEHIGIITSEKVCFLGDSIFGYETLEKYPIPFLFNIEESINTLNTIKALDADFFIISHEKKVLDANEIKDLADKNLERIENIKNTILELLDQPCTKEDILENIIVLNDMSTNFKQYHLDYSSISAFISYLFDNNLIDYSLEDGKLYFFKK
ncbi:MBL fold metallo-hydrolase [Clostridium botulinum C]|uniref:MBL fold metallo-hydrolase n=1 Tax=Clostridium botulinum TaxID=1491 RepID=UPI001E3D4285|nr:MBL fold metallo-hydrolase [Clostridium botulinum]MCD3216290.1 MBL fold metallo-hydrolase [Clostridium botulinum C]